MQAGGVNSDAASEGNRPLRVLFVIPQGSGASSMVFARRQSESMEESGIVGLKYFLESRTNPRVIMAERKRLQSEIQAFKPDVVHAHFGTMTGFFCAYSSPVPVVISYRGSDLNPAPSMPQMRWRLAHLLSQLAALRAARIVCVSEGLRRRLWWRRNIVTVIPSGVDASRFSPRPLEEARAELGWDIQERIVMFNAGRTPMVKRLDLAESAIRKAEQIVGPIRFVVMRGDTDPGQVAAMLNAANCLLVTSDFEGSPTIVQEAMACNLPVVTVEVGDVRERLAAVVPSRIVSRDPVEIGRAVADFLTDGRRSNGAAAAQMVSLGLLRAELEGVYRSAAARSS